MKTCKKCGEIKPHTEYYQKKNGVFQARCKPCYKLQNKENAIKNQTYRKAVLKYANKWGKGVYGIFENGICLYVGESSQLKHRFIHHISLNSNIKDRLANHSGFVIGIIEQTENHKEREQHYINKLKPLYNG